MCLFVNALYSNIADALSHCMNNGDGVEGTRNNPFIVAVVFFLSFTHYFA